MPDMRRITAATMELGDVVRLPGDEAYSSCTVTGVSRLKVTLVRPYLAVNTPHASEDGTAVIPMLGMETFSVWRESYSIFVLQRREAVK